MALLIGGAAATAINALFAIVFFFLVTEMGQDPDGPVLDVYATIGTVVMGAAVSGPLLFTRPRGPVAPILAVVFAIIANIFGDLLGAYGYNLMQGQTPEPGYLDAYFRAFGHYTVFAWFLFLLAPIVAAALAGLRVMMVGRAPQQQPAAGPWGLRAARTHRPRQAADTRSPGPVERTRRRPEGTGPPPGSRIPHSRTRGSPRIRMLPASRTRDSRVRTSRRRGKQHSP
ncbi:hypothetical protein [Actinomadura keratinilytica]|uniref:hypothetical protein n=1 Tax=Actinomadura keratinilytica TaxID=547461 RepID=UPI00361651F3